MRFFTIDSIPHFEILERKKIDTVDDREGIKLSQNLTLTSFDSGHWAIPSFELPADKPMYTDSIPVDVGFSPFDPNQDYHDIKDVIDVQVKEKKEETWYWYAAASALLIAAIIYFLVRKRKNLLLESRSSILTKRRNRNWKNWERKICPQNRFIQGSSIFSDFIFQEERELLLYKRQPMILLCSYGP